ncbi:hypothetical protein L3Q82_026079, partial [Scortum barcoo]
MMKLILSLTLIWALSSTAGALQCQICSNSKCSSTEPSTCPSNTLCATVIVEVITSGTTEHIISKSCAASSTCPVTGTLTTSQSFGDVSEVTSTQCCKTENCNSETLPSPPAPTTNSLQCFTCNSNGSECNIKLQCRGVEDRCFELDVPAPTTNSLQCFTCNSNGSECNVLCVHTKLQCRGVEDRCHRQSTVSQSYSGLTAVTSAKCCSTDNCNSETLLFPAAPTTNSLQCFTCDLSSFPCTTKLQCREVEDRCFKMT